ncbi:MAG: DMT family transporter [Vicinamibacterales bacterium]
MQARVGHARMAAPGTATTATQARLGPHVIDTLLLVTPGVIWGASFLFIAEGLAALPPDGITFLRFVIGFLTLACVPGARQAVPREDWPKIVGLGLVWMAFPMSLFPHAEQHVSSALTGMLNGAIPLLSAIAGTLITRTLPSRAVVIGLAVGFSGAVLMALPGIGAGGTEARGVLLIGVALVSYGVAIHIARPLQQRHGALPVVWRALGVSLVVTAPLGLPALTHAVWVPRAFAAVLALGAFGTAIANVIRATAAGRLGAVRASGSAFIIPVVALVLGVLVRGESVPAAALAGGALCLTGAWLLRRATLAHAASVPSSRLLERRP